MARPTAWWGHCFMLTLILIYHVSCFFTDDDDCSNYHNTGYEIIIFLYKHRWNLFLWSEKSETCLMKWKITLNWIAQRIFYYNIFHKCFMIWRNFSLMKCVMKVNLNIFVISSPCMCDVNLTLMQLSKKNSETL